MWKLFTLLGNNGASNRTLLITSPQTGAFRVHHLFQVPFTSFLGWVDFAWGACPDCPFWLEPPPAALTPRDIGLPVSGFTSLFNLGMELLVDRGNDVALGADVDRRVVGFLMLTGREALIPPTPDPGETVGSDLGNGDTSAFRLGW